MWSARSSDVRGGVTDGNLRRLPCAGLRGINSYSTALSRIAESTCSVLLMLVSVDVAQLLGGAFGGAVASSVIGPLLADRGTRRALRGDVLRSLSQVERTRWAGGEWQWDDFRAAKHSLRAAALVAGANREVVDRYLRLATVARQESDRSAELVPDEEGGGAVSSTLGTLVSDSASARRRRALAPSPPLPS
jgi:hypothetical protein